MSHGLKYLFGDDEVENDEPITKTHENDADTSINMKIHKHINK